MKHTSKAICNLLQRPQIVGAIFAFPLCPCPLVLCQRHQSVIYGPAVPTDLTGGSWIQALEPQAKAVPAYLGFFKNLRL